METINAEDVKAVVTTETTTMVIEEPTSKLTPEVERIAKLVEDAATEALKGNTTGAAAIEKTLYATSILDDEITPAIVERFVGKHRATQAGLALGGANAAFKYMEANPDVNVVRLDLPTFGKDHYALKVTREREVAGKPSYGIVQVSHELHGGGKDDPMVQVKSIVSNKARDIFSKL